jgi:hypothetical protein
MSFTTVPIRSFHRLPNCEHLFFADDLSHLSVKDEREWMEDPDPDSGVDVEGYGWMCLRGGSNKENVQEAEAGITKKDGKGDLGQGKVFSKGY